MKKLERYIALLPFAFAGHNFAGMLLLNAVYFGHYMPGGVTALLGGIVGIILAVVFHGVAYLLVS